MHLLKFLHRFRRSPNKVKGSAGSTTLGDEIRRLASTLADSNERKGFESEMQGFKEIFDRYVGEKNRGDIDWSKVTAARADIVSYDSLLQGADNETLRKLAVLKVNGGLGTSMGLTGAKSVLEVQDGLTFLDLIVQQIQHINISRGVDIPLILMTSFGTHEDTIRIIKNRQHVRITSFNQSRYPWFFADTHVLCPEDAGTSNKSAWYPPGHGDLYKSLYMSGVLDSLLSEGKEYLFVSNADNLAATVDAKLLQHMIDTQSEFLMEVVDKTKADIQGGTLVDYAGSIQLLELAQVPQDHLDEFSSARKFSTFNTNNLWIDLKAIRRVMGNGGMLLPIIETVKTLDDGRTVVQLETAAGSAIKHFRNAHGVHVPRARFLPVKDCSDLLMVRSDLYKVINGQLIFNDKRMFKTTPIVKLGDQFRNIDSFQRRFKTIPSLVDLDHLTVAGDVSFGRSVTLRGTVVVAANEGQTIEVPDGSLLENKLVAGALNMTRL
ncbi:utp-glucose-1-phosphate uridylyltransferase [Moniliophthora roreri MCA 2997]|uniref:UTP--glucose-1-phosphate uridylyltransferase n=1 Tax=Moniliophthora roreri (strain MCA 2997) TaxID=1381753 RepID=V2YZB4_MONRO|nr:utp-glucose-1-phosphate uridylyltransferase [Moniliophthora roreri MCA 2997]KAI3618665.1 utp-glucose-1-phosphate uridylyltransferase [Moniliophthora roreri]